MTAGVFAEIGFGYLLKKSQLLPREATFAVVGQYQRTGIVLTPLVQEKLPQLKERFLSLAVATCIEGLLVLGLTRMSCCDVQDTFRCHGYFESKLVTFRSLISFLWGNEWGNKFNVTAKLTLLLGPHSQNEQFMCLCICIRSRNYFEHSEHDGQTLFSLPWLP